MRVVFIEQMKIVFCFLLW